MAILRLDHRPKPYASNPTIELGVESWAATQIFDFVIIPKHDDASVLYMFCTCMAEPILTGEMCIGRFTGSVADPYTWTNPIQVLTKGAGGSYDANHVRLASGFYDNGTYYLYYTSYNSPGVCLATSTDGTNFTKHASNPLLTPDGQGRDDGTSVNEGAVIKEGSSWTMIYSYNNGDLGHPAGTLNGYRYATSSDGISWTKGGSGDVLTTKPLFGEWHQIFKHNGLYILLYEAGNDSTSYRIFAATSGVVTGPYTNLPTGPVLTESGTVGAWDRYHVATPWAMEINGAWKMFYCAAGDHFQPYGTNTWPAGIADFPDTAFCAGSRGRGR